MQMRPEKEVPKPDSKPVKMGLEGGGCPFGTVPIRRTSKDDLLRAKLGTHVSYNLHCIAQYADIHYLILYGGPGGVTGN